MRCIQTFYLAEVLISALTNARELDVPGESLLRLL